MENSAQTGTLVNCDVPTRQYITFLNDQEKEPFVLDALAGGVILIDSSWVEWLDYKIAAFYDEHIHLPAKDVSTLRPTARGAAPLPLDSKVYIEDTDAFGMVYNANYAALYDHWREANKLPDINRVAEMSFKSTAQLGDILSVRGEATGADNVFDVCVERGEALVNAATVHLGEAGRPHALFADAAAQKSLDVRAWESELAADGRPTLRAVLCYFERVRTEMLGGPAALRRLSEDGDAVVVAKVKNLVRGGPATGPALVCRSSAVVRRGTIISFRQELSDAGSGAVLASGEVTCVSIAASGRPKRLPEWVQALF